MATTYPKSLHRGHWLDNEWTQLLLIVGIGVFLPPLIRFGGNVTSLLAPTTFNSIVASLAAALFSWYGLDKLRYFAKARRLSYVFPMVTAGYLSAAVVIGVLRLDYSLTVLALTFFAVLTLCYVIAALTRKSHALQWRVPGGAIDVVAGQLGQTEMLDLATMRALLARRRNGDCGSIIADLHHGHSAEWEALLAEAAICGIPVYHYRLLLELQTGQVRIDHMRENNLGSLIPNLAYLGLKRLADIIVSLISLVFLLPIFAVVAIVIRMDSKGSVLFMQDRIGYKGRPFRMVKFRTMIDRSLFPEAHVHTGVEDAMTRTGDRRITRVGTFLRKTRLDELPQVFNILRGDMSWIGPRPEALSLSELYQETVPFYRFRHIVRPGVSGWAQVNQGHVVQVDDITEKLRYDFYYVRNVSLWLDLLIAMKTIRVVLSGFGAK